tara:strand:- start:41914 stop:42210 length:297 start_codon:yes stop_codon:yes gene_type:complete
MRYRKNRINGNDIDKRFVQKLVKCFEDYESLQRRNKLLKGHYKSYLKLREEIKLVGVGLVSDKNWKNYKNYHKYYKMFNDENGRWKHLIECGTLKSDN